MTFTGSLGKANVRLRGKNACFLCRLSLGVFLSNAKGVDYPPGIWKQSCACPNNSVQYSAISDVLKCPPPQKIHTIKK